ncbi:MAG: hypothetical protein Q8R53_06290 [Nanoarchaeota archaeon]|nr:hypothetical protein [Nanoarchaeota archaeon]
MTPKTLVVGIPTIYGWGGGQINREEVLTMKMKVFHCVETYATPEGLEGEVNKFLESGIRVVSPPQIIQNSSVAWHAVVFYEQPSSPGINDDDRQQRSLTAEDVQKSERLTEAYCRQGGIPYERVFFLSKEEVEKRLAEGEPIIAAGEAALREVQRKAGTVYISDKRRK